ncbi:MAG TPA: hypothetical protein VIL86_20310 [Tepidisphaeraceae bacterium]|jgi:hypothetical protein
MLEQLNEYVRELIRSERYDDDGGFWHFGDGVECGICTNAAVRVAEAFHGAVWGYSADQYPAASAGRPIGVGHDFAVVDHSP